MLKLKAVDKNGNEVNLGTPVGVMMRCESSVPADSLLVRLTETGLEQLNSVELYRNDELIFSGEVDEQAEELSTSPYTELSARSSAGKLIDNEAYPISLENPSAEDIFRCFAKPLGFDELKGKNREYNGKFTVRKGMSCYEAVNNFSKAVYGAFPKCEGNVLYIDGKIPEGRLIFGTDGIPIESLRVSHFRCKRISEVFVKLSDDGGYTQRISNAVAQKDGVNKVRYVNASPESSKTLEDAEKIITESESKCLSVQVICYGFFGDALNKSASVSGVEDELYVDGVKYSFGKNGEYTRLSLKRKEKIHVADITS